MITAACWHAYLVVVCNRSRIHCTERNHAPAILWPRAPSGMQHQAATLVPYSTTPCNTIQYKEDKLKLRKASSMFSHRPTISVYVPMQPNIPTTVSCPMECPTPKIAGELLVHVCQPQHEQLLLLLTQKDMRGGVVMTWHKVRQL